MVEQESEREALERHVEQLTLESERLEAAWASTEADRRRALEARLVVADAETAALRADVDALEGKLAEVRRLIEGLRAADDPDLLFQVGFAAGLWVSSTVLAWRTVGLPAAAVAAAVVPIASALGQLLRARR